MALDTIIIIVIIAFVILFAWTLFKKVFKIMFYLGLIVIFLLLLNMLFLYQDVADLRENFAVQEKKVILVDNEEVISGLLLSQDVDLLTDKQLEDFSEKLKDEEYDESPQRLFHKEKLPSYAGLSSNDKKPTSQLHPHLKAYTLLLFCNSAYTLASSLYQLVFLHFVHP